MWGCTSVMHSSCLPVKSECDANRQANQMKKCLKMNDSLTEQTAHTWPHSTERIIFISTNKNKIVGIQTYSEIEFSIEDK